MDDGRLRCAELAVRRVPEDYRTVEATDLAGQERGRSFHRGMYIGWAWGVDERGRIYLDFLFEHPHPGMAAERYFADGRIESIAVPAGARTTSSDPAEDAKLEQEFLERNRAAYAGLRDRGLMPEQGANLVSQDISEYLLTGGPDARSSQDAATTVAGACGVRLGGGWDELLREELDKPYWTTLLDFVTDEYEHHEVYPPWERVFAAFALTPVDEVRGVIVGQDPYIRPGQAHGLAFSVPAGVPIPPSLRKIRQELAADLGISPSDLPVDGDLTGWAEQDVLLLNTTLTVRGGQSGSHHGKGWENSPCPGS
jgi:hypothetical protein